MEDWRKEIYERVYNQTIEDAMKLYKGLIKDVGITAGKDEEFLPKDYITNKIKSIILKRGLPSQMTYEDKMAITWRMRQLWEDSIIKEPYFIRNYLPDLKRITKNILEDELGFDKDDMYYDEYYEKTFRRVLFVFYIGLHIGLAKRNINIDDIIDTIISEYETYKKS